MYSWIVYYRDMGIFEDIAADKTAFQEYLQKHTGEPAFIQYLQPLAAEGERHPLTYINDWRDLNWKILVRTDAFHKNDDQLVETVDQLVDLISFLLDDGVTPQWILDTLRQTQLIPDRPKRDSGDTLSKQQ